MQITSLVFVLFLCAVLAAYFLAPKKWQWVVLLAASLAFYCTYDVRHLAFVLFTSFSTWGATMAMARLDAAQKRYLGGEGKALSREDKAAYRAGVKKRKKRIMLLALLANLSILLVFKYFHFALEQVNRVLSIFRSGPLRDPFRFLAPLGLSFYTFQMLGYLLDSYWGNVAAERNPLKTLLFCSFFPQMTQGPISEFGQLSEQLFTGHGFTYRNWSWGSQRLVWGLFKKMVVADAFAPAVQRVFAQYGSYSGASAFLGILLYAVQIYADFSGYMDIMCGLCEIMGIRLTENFDRPYFSKSVAEYWRRWHISLGAWFKRYVYYPIGVSKWNRALGRSARARFGKRFGDMLPASVALVVVWLATGLWHGANWGYAVWGLLNGLFIILGLWLEPVWAACRAKLRVREDSRPWRAFQALRTFLLVAFIKVLPEVGSLRDGLGLWRRVFTGRSLPRGLRQLLPFVDWSSSFTAIHFFVACAGTAAMLAVSLLQRRRPVRSLTEKWPMPLRALLFAGVILLIAVFGVQNTWMGGGFLYAQF